MHNARATAVFEVISNPMTVFRHAQAPVARRVNGQC
jgi:hypothetical protein